MLVLIAILIIVCLLYLILSKKTSALTALILVPIIGAFIAGFGLETFDFAMAGIKSIASIAAMFVFAIIFFGVLTDAGMFDPIINRILKMVGHNPMKITIGSAVLAMIVHLDGSGAITFLIAIPAMLPLYDRLQMDRRVLAAVVALGAGTMNIVPWGGPTLRAATALQVAVTDLYNPIFIPQVGGLLFVIGVAYYLGRKEARRLDLVNVVTQSDPVVIDLSDAEIAHRRPKLFWWNILLTLAAISTLLSGIMAPTLVFMLGATFALLLNYPKLKDQKERIDAHAKAALLMASILLAAGVFTGIMTESGMINEIAEKAVELVPPGLGKHIPVVMAVLGMPLSLVFDPDSFYFGFLPVLSEVSEGLGISGIKVGQAAILGQMTTGFPYSPLTATTFLLIGLAKIELADHQRFSMKYAFFTTLFMTLLALIMGIFPI